MGTITISLDKEKTAKCEAIRSKFYKTLSFDDAVKEFVYDCIAKEQVEPVKVN